MRLLGSIAHLWTVLGEAVKFNTHLDRLLRGIAVPLQSFSAHPNGLQVATLDNDNSHPA